MSTSMSMSCLYTGYFQDPSFIFSFTYLYISDYGKVMTTQHSDALRSSGGRNSHHFLCLSFADFPFPSPLLLTLPQGGNHFSSGTVIHLYPGAKYNQKTGSGWLSLGAWPPWRRRKSHFGLKSLTHSLIKLYHQSSWSLSFIWFSSLVQTSEQDLAYGERKNC